MRVAGYRSLLQGLPREEGRPPPARRPANLRYGGRFARALFLFFFFFFRRRRENSLAPEYVHRPEVEEGHTLLRPPSPRLAGRRREAGGGEAQW